MSSNQTDVVFFDENGLRTDQRKPDEIRPMKIKIGVLSRANGSCYLEWGANKVIAAVYGPREAHPRRMQLAGKAVIRYRYNMQSFSVEDRARPGPSRRSSEISKVSREAFEPVIFSDAYPKAAIDIFVEVLQADAGTRTAAINAASLALVDAGIPMRGLISACAAGKVGGKIVLDLNKPEDNYGEADLPIAMTEDGKITLIQMDGHLTPSEFEEAMELVQKGCRRVLEIQKAALMEKYASIMDDEEDEDEIGSENGAEDEIGADDEADEDDEGLIEFSSVDESDAQEEDFDEVTDEMVEAFVNRVSETLAKDISSLIREYEVGGSEADVDLADGLFDDDINICIRDADLKEIDELITKMEDEDDDFDDEDCEDEETDIFVITAEDDTDVEEADVEESDVDDIDEEDGEENEDAEEEDGEEFEYDDEDEDDEEE
ncbi:MAG: exosome complex exonuclease Rrp41 [Methanimicrococcus sp.]|nr:exosome complex exonuclease Rrp41 [Methanimicrococcus sp.]